MTTKPSAQALLIARNVEAELASVADRDMTAVDRLRLRDARAIIDRNHEINLRNQRRADEIDEAYQRGVADSRREGRRIANQQAHARTRGGAGIDACRKLFGRGRIAKKMHGRKGKRLMR